MTRSERLYTADEFFELVALPENREKRLELDNGVIVEVVSSNSLNATVAARIRSHLDAYVAANDLGVVTGADVGYKLASNCVRLPDVGFVSKARLTRRPEYFDIPPDLAVEIASDGEDVFRKAREYLHSGVQLVWAVYADEQVVYVMNLHLDSSIRAIPFGIGTALNGGYLLPGFTLAVRDIFPE